MAPASQLDPGGSPDSACRNEGPRSISGPVLPPELEAEYTQAHLLNSRTLIRVACLFASLLVIMRGAEHALRGAWSALLLPHFVLVLTGSIVLAVIAWSPAFGRFYLPCARIIVPARSAIVAAHVAYAAAAGALDELMILPLVLIGPFFFLGLRFRTALVACVLALTSFVAAAVYCGLPLPLLFRTCTLLILSAAACAIAARHLEQASRRRFLERRIIAELAQYDALTGTKNRRVFDEHLARIWRRAIADRCAIAVLLIDVDHFKAYNDRYGHQAGDFALRRLAEVLQAFVRGPLDIVARYGGEEFAAVFYNVDALQAEEIADGMRRAVEDLGIEHRGSRTCDVLTLSAGIAVIRPTAERNPRGALQLADEALYAAKRGGRNRVELMGEAEYKLVVTGVFAVPHGMRVSHATGQELATDG